MKKLTHIRIAWVDGRREPRCPPDPDYPDGKHVDGSEPGQESCRVDLPYPAKRCGMYVVECRRCGMTAALTTAGRPDDPRSVAIGCRRWRS